MNDDFSAEFDALREDLSTEGENEEEKIRRMAEEAKAAKASAPPAEAPAPQAAAPEAAQPAPEAPQEAEGGGGDVVRQALAGVDPTGALSGVGKWVEENINIPVIDMLDGSRDAEQVAADRAEMRAGQAEYDQEIRENAGNEVGRTVLGAGAGAAEGALSAAEILGDTAKSIPGLLNQDWKPDAKDDIFQFGPNSKYEWAKWDLGKDDIGAQTAVGKITQGFLEVGALMAATGGFAGAAKGAGVLKSGLIGGRSGIAADMISASNGEGGLSNVIRENAPEWYPKWLTMLAVDNDDSPLEVMGKVAAEGFFLGFAADAAGAYVVATRAVKKYLKEHPKATPAELDAVAANNYAKAQLESTRAQNGGKTAEEAVEHMRNRMETLTRPAPLYHATSKAAADAIRKGGFKGGSEGTNILGSGVYTASDARYAKSYGEEVLEIDAQGLNIRDMDRPMQQFMDENGIKYKYYDLSTGADVDIKNTNLTPEDIGLDIDPASKKKLRELLSEGGQYQGVKYDPVFQENARGTGEEVLLFDPSQARIAKPRTTSDVSKFTGYRRLLEEAGEELAFYGDTILKENYMRLYEQAANGIPVSIDDVKLLFPDRFTPGTRVITEPTIVGLDGALNSLPQTGGFTINPVTGEAPTDGVMVAIDGISLKQFDEESIANFMADNYDLLSRDDVFVGGWISEITGKPEIELSRLVGDESEAIMLGKLFDQEGVFRNADFEYIPTGGADELKRTAGLHERSQTAREPLGPGPADPVEAQASAVQNLNYRSGEMVQEVMTQPKFEMIAEGTDDYTRRLLQDMLNDGTIPLNNLSKVVGKPVDVIAKEAREYIQMVTGGSGKIDFDKINASMTAKDQYGKPILGDAQLVAVIQMMKDTSQQLAKSAKSIADKFDSGMDVADDFSRLVIQQKALMKIHKETVSYQGRSLWNNKIRLDDIDVDNPLPNVDVQKLQRQYDKATKKLDRIEEAVRSGDPKAKQEAYQLALQLRLADGNPEDFVGINKSIGNGITEQLLGNMYNSLLSGPETHLVNTLSSLFMTFYRPLNLAVGSGFKQNKEAFSAFHGINQTLSDAWRLATDAYTKAKSGQVANAKSGQKLTSGLEQLRIHQEYAETSSNPFVKMAVGFESMLYDLKNNPYLAWSGPLMEAEDTFSSAISARFEFNMNMMRRAIDEADDGSVESVFKSLLNQEKKRYFTESGEILDPSLQQVADENTFRHKLEGSALGFSKFIQAVPALRPFFPFVKTGHNIMVFTAESTPLTVFTKEWQDTMAGSDESAKAILRGRAATGSFIMLNAAMLASAGIITGAGPATGPERDAWERNHKPRSIKIGDTWVSYERMEPFSSVIQAAADITYGIKRGLIDENKAQFLASYITYAFAQNFTDKSVFSGLDPLSKLLNPGFNPSGTVTVPVDLANNVLPLASLRRMLANAMEPHKQYYDQQWQRALDQAFVGLIPGLGNTQYDWLDGSPVTSGNQGLYNAISPLNVHKRGTDIVRDTLESLGYDSQTILKTVENENLSAAERSELGKLMGSGALYEELETVIKHRKYDEFAKELRAARARDTDLTGLLEKGGNLGRDRDQSVYVEINEIVMKHRDMAIQAIRSKNSRLNTEIGKKQRRKDQARTRTAEDLRNFHKN